MIAKVIARWLVQIVNCSTLKLHFNNTTMCISALFKTVQNYNSWEIPSKMSNIHITNFGKRWQSRKINKNQSTSTEIVPWHVKNKKTINISIIHMKNISHLINTTVCQIISLHLPKKFLQLRSRWKNLCTRIPRKTAHHLHHNIEHHQTVYYFPTKINFQRRTLFRTRE